MILKCQIFREVQEGPGEKKVRKYETMDIELKYEGDGNILTSSHPDKLYGAWIVLKENPK